MPSYICLEISMFNLTFFISRNCLIFDLRFLLSIRRYSSRGDRLLMESTYEWLLASIGSCIMCITVINLPLSLSLLLTFFSFFKPPSFQFPSKIFSWMIAQQLHYDKSMSSPGVCINDAHLMLRTVTSRSKRSIVYFRTTVNYTFKYIL